jgi:MFS family permease
LVYSLVAPNIQTLIVARFFSGVSGSAFLSVAGGTVGDLFHRNELGGPMMFYTASPFIGPEIGLSTFYSFCISVFLLPYDFSSSHLSIFSQWLLFALEEFFK